MAGLISARCAAVGFRDSCRGGRKSIFFVRCAVPSHRTGWRPFYFKTHSEQFVPGGLLVHVAPEPELRKRLQSRARCSGVEYRVGGITGTGQEHLDLRNLPFGDNSVHLLYCCHVLNCMQDDRAAMAEVLRVLHPRGVALLQVPAFYRGAETRETNGRE